MTEVSEAGYFNIVANFRQIGGSGRGGKRHLKSGCPIEKVHAKHRAAGCHFARYYFGLDADDCSRKGGVPIIVVYELVNLEMFRCAQEAETSPHQPPGRQIILLNAAKDFDASADPWEICLPQWAQRECRLCHFAHRIGASY